MIFYYYLTILFDYYNFLKFLGYFFLLELNYYLFLKNDLINLLYYFGLKFGNQNYNFLKKFYMNLILPLFLNRILNYN